MLKQDYLELGFTNEDAEFLETYPKLYAICSTYGISKQQIDNIFNKFDDSTWIRTQTDHKLRQSYLHGMFFRLNYFNKSFELERYKGLNTKEVIELFGKWNVRFAEELLNVI